MTVPRSIRINDRLIGQETPAYIVAEMSANHEGDFSKAVKILEEAKAAGADAVKLQTYTADTLTIKSDQDCFLIGQGSPWEGKRLYDLYQEAYTPWEWHPKLKEVADHLGLDIFSSPFDATAVEFLEKMEVPCYKIASFEIIDIPLIRRVAQTGKPLILSTGLATQEEIAEAVKEARTHGAKEIMLLKCTSAYPAPLEEMNLRAIPVLANTYDVPAGLSDHTLGLVVPVAAVALGACLIEKHFTLSRANASPDRSFSMEPEEFKAMVEAVRATEKALGQPDFVMGEKEKISRGFRRSLFVVQDINAGEVFTEKNVRSIRPGNGLLPRYFENVLGRRSTRPIRRGSPLTWDLVERKMDEERKTN
ncbi:MAG: pseudaminic acid synthase [Elusimicrobia bacterium]|nr:pseudaminic acid synthase [Elusimicrobiota bacterium]